VLLPDATRADRSGVPGEPPTTTLGTLVRPPARGFDLVVPGDDLLRWLNGVVSLP